MVSNSGDLPKEPVAALCEGWVALWSALPTRHGSISTGETAIRKSGPYTDLRKVSNF